jgi:hypothetical protein
VLVTAGVCCAVCVHWTSGGALRVRRSSAPLEVMSQRFPNDLGDGNSLILGPTCEALLDVWVEPNGFDRRWRCAKARAAPLAPPGDDPVDIVSEDGFVGQLVDEVIVDGLARMSVSVGGFGHRSRSFR